MTTLALTKEIFVPREIIFELWTDSAHLQSWFPHGPSSDVSFALDLAEGGAYDFSWRDDAGNLVRETGVLTLIEAPERLGFTLRTPSGNDRNVELTLRDLNGSTEIHIHEQGFATAGERDAREAEWRQRIADLESYLSSI